MLIDLGMRELYRLTDTITARSLHIRRFGSLGEKFGIGFIEFLRFGCPFFFSIFASPFDRVENPIHGLGREVTRAGSQFLLEGFFSPPFFEADGSSENDHHHDDHNDGEDDSLSSRDDEILDLLGDAGLAGSA
jgi:hypothetical protein